MATATYYKEEVTALLKAKSFAKLLFNSVVLVNIGAILIITSVDLLRLSPSITILPGEFSGYSGWY